VSFEEVRVMRSPSAPPVLAEACFDFAPELDEPGVCAGCGWLEEEHQAAIDPATSIAA
jgi:hypothetical protein